MDGIVLAIVLARYSQIINDCDGFRQRIGRSSGTNIIIIISAFVYNCHGVNPK